MTDRRDFLTQLAALGVAGAWSPRSAPTASAANDRQYWVDVLVRITRPVLENLAEAQLRARMPVEIGPTGGRDRASYSHLEAVGRTLSGIGPWLELGADATPEGQQRARIADLARRGIANATDPKSRDFLNFSSGGQPLVDAAFLAHALVRAPRELWQKLDATTQANVVRALESTRTIKPPESNWLLFSAMVEAALERAGAEWKREPVDYALRQHERWYKGDGMYGDGPSFHWDYYNSYVIQPMLLDVTRVFGASVPEWNALAPEIGKRAVRYAAIQERLISPEGTFPSIGRSLAYRFGAFQLLGQMALRHELPEDVAPSQVRAALTAVIRRMIEAPGTFDANGWLTIGFAGHQPSIAEGYISTGSLYLCCAGLLPLGLPANDEFWVAEAKDWTSRMVWGGKDLRADHAL
jgi:hypothetical protein